MQLTFALGGKFSHKLERKLGYKKSLLMISLIPAILFIAMGVLDFIWLAIFPAVIYFMDAFKNIVTNDYVNKNIPSSQRATILSMGFCLFNIFASIANPIMGFIADRFGLKISFVILGILLFTLMMGLNSILNNSSATDLA